jgi:acetyl esterase
MVAAAVMALETRISKVVVCGSWLMLGMMAAADLAQAAAFRAMLNAIAFKTNAAAVSVSRVEDLKVPGPYGDIPLRIYWPPVPPPALGSASTPGALPGLFYIHGAGWVGGTLETHDNIARLLARNASVVLISINYRLAPEFKYPVALDESYAGLLWFVKNAPKLGVDPARIAIAGDSAGGNLAAALALMLRDRKGPQVRAQFLINPALDLASFDTASYRAAPPPVLRMMEFFRRQYVGPAQDLRQAYLSPALAGDLSQLPPAFVISSEFDAFRDEDQAYVVALGKAGVSAEGFMVKNIGHLGMTWATADPKINDALAASVLFLQKALE